MFILGIDPAVNNTGYAILKIEGKKIFFLKSGVIKNKTTLSFFEKMENLVENINTIIHEQKIDHIAVESAFLNNNPSTSIKLGVVKGILYSISIHYKIKLFEYSAKEVKKNITGNGNSEKSAVLNEILRILPKLKIKTYDESDAIAIAINHCFITLNNYLNVME